MRIAVTGATGFLGRALVAHFADQGHDCIALTRNVARAATLGFPASVRLASIDTLPPADVVIHLAGESIVGYWTARRRRAIMESRVEGTRRLVAALRSAKTRPHTLLSASAIGFYGHRPGELLEETAESDPQDSYRAEVCRAWEKEALVADVLGVRVITLRIGNVLDPHVGFLGELLRIYRHFGGWIFGDPRAAISWIGLEDTVRMIDFALANERWYGPLNVVAPQAVTQLQFAAAVGERLGHSGVRQIPAWLTRAVLGQFSSALLDDQHVVPAKALAAGFAFQNPDLDSYLDGVFEAVSPARVEPKFDVLATDRRG